MIKQYLLDNITNKLNMLKMSAINILVILALVSTSLASRQPEFKSDAADKMTIQHKTNTRRREQIHDYTKLEIEASLMDMLEDGSNIDKDRVLVEYKSAAMSDYKMLESEVQVRGGVYKWTIPDIVPCHDHNVRLSVFGENDGPMTTFSYPHTIVAPHLKDILATGYRPTAPANIQFGDYSNGQIEVSWTPSHCAETYEVLYVPIIGDNEDKDVVTVNNRIILENLDDCQEYEITVTPRLGEQYGEEIMETFMTYPSDDVAERLTPDITTETNSVSVKWRGSEKLSCIPRYAVQLCEHQGQCHGNIDMDRDDSLAFMEFTSPNLAMCTRYSLSIRPVHDRVFVNPKVVEFKTKSQPLDSIENVLGPVSATIGQDLVVSVTWSPVPCAEIYHVYRRRVDSETWEKVGSTDMTNFQLQGESCSEYIYAVEVVIDGVESIKVESEKSVIAELNNDELPIMIVEEKANGSITLVLKSSELNTMCEVRS